MVGVGGSVYRPYGTVNPVVPDPVPLHKGAQTNELSILFGHQHIGGTEWIVLMFPYQRASDLGIEDSPRD